MERLSGLASMSEPLEVAISGVKLFSIINLGVTLVGFSVTWFQAWWSTVIAILVSAYGYYIMQNTRADIPVDKVKYLLVASGVSLLCHTISLGIACYAAAESALFSSLKVVEDELKRYDKPTAFYVFLILFLLVEMQLMAILLFKTYMAFAALSSDSNVYYAMQNDLSKPMNTSNGASLEQGNSSVYRA